ncbi:hypothetical protein J6590_042857 [Homalodisca vitripennis]|nr:hypothetical protein J6590_042857 [Homalodisca vitripennis]
MEVLGPRGRLVDDISKVAALAAPAEKLWSTANKGQNITASILVKRRILVVVNIEICTVVVTEALWGTLWSSTSSQDVVHSPVPDKSLQLEPFDVRRRSCGPSKADISIIVRRRVDCEAGAAFYHLSAPRRDRPLPDIGKQI